MTRTWCVLLVCLATSVLNPLAYSAEDADLPLAAVPDNGVLQLTDYGYRDWGPELVRYRVNAARFPAGRLALVDEAGKGVPCQIKDGVLSFVAEVKNGKSVTYTLQAADRDRSAENSALTRKIVGEFLEVQNSHLALRLPRPQEQTPAQPVAAEQVPPPLRAWKQTGYDWCGGARFLTERKVVSYRMRVLEEGPATVVYEARYRFAPQGDYLWRVRVSDGLRSAVVTEEFDFGEITAGQDFLLLDLSQNWQPDQLGFIEDGSLKLRPTAEFIRQKAGEQDAIVKNVTPYAPPRPFLPGKGLVLLDKIGAAGAWGMRGGVELRSVTKAGDKTLTRSVSACPWHVGSWRRALGWNVWHDPARGVVTALPISVRLSRWNLDVTDDQSPFSTHEHDPELPASYGRRVWALGCGVEDVVGVRIASGYIGLDRYKDWIVAWPENKSVAKYPRAYATPAILDRLRRSLASHPEKANLEKLYLFNGQKDAAIASAHQALRNLTAPYGSPWQIIGLPGYNDTYFRSWMPYAEDALACPDLPAELRTELRRRLALWAHLYAEPDYNPRPSGVHLGNPNMPIGRTLALVAFAAVLPDHPQYKVWMEQLQAWTAYRLAINTTPGGAWFEPPTYQMYGPTRSLTISQILLRNGGFGDLAAETYHAKALEYDAHLTVLDPRYKGSRILPGMGNSGNTLEAVWGLGVGVVEQADRETAGFLRFMHRLASGNQRLTQGDGPDYSFFYLPDVPERPRTLGTTYIPGYGVAFRAHFGAPQETALLFRCGYNKSHWDMDDLNVILYGRGAPLSPGTGYQYYYGPATENNAVYHNRIKPGDPNAREPFGRVENTIQDYGFGQHADYAVGRQYYPPECFPQDQGGELEWRRHILFLKSQQSGGANYFVLRDSFLGPEGRAGGIERPAWWHWLNLETAERIRVNGQPFDKDAVPFNKVMPDSATPALRGRTLELATDYRVSTYMWFAQPAEAEVRALLTFDYNMAPNYHHRSFGKQLGVPDQDVKETKTKIRMTGTTRDGFFYVVYPRQDGETPPQCTTPAPGCIKVVTGEATDYLFAGDAPLDFRAEGVEFTGRAGAVRVFSDRVALCLNSGSGRVGYKGYVLTGHGPFERVVPLRELKASAQDVGGTEKQLLTIQTAAGITVRGEGPFTVSVQDRAIRIRTSGRARTLLVTRPPYILRPDLFVDGRRWMAGWSDYASSDWGRMQHTDLIAVSTLDGDHELVIRDMVFPKAGPRPFQPGLR